MDLLPLLHLHLPLHSLKDVLKRWSSDPSRGWEILEWFNDHGSSELWLGGSLEAISWAWHSSKLRMSGYPACALVACSVKHLEVAAASFWDKGHTRVVLWDQVHDLIEALWTECPSPTVISCQQCADLFDPLQHENAIHPSFLLNTDNPSSVSL